MFETDNDLLRAARQSIISKIDSYENGVLQPHPESEGTDYVLSEDARSCWITVGNISVHIFRPHGVDGVGVNLYPAHHEFLDELDSAIATHREAGEAIAEYDEENNVE